MSTVLVTGSSGLVGSTCVRHFHALGWEVHGLDNNARREYFGSDGDTTPTYSSLLKDCHRATLHNVNVCAYAQVRHLVGEIGPDLIIHAAAQPSHDYAAQYVFTDFDINATGTLTLLEVARRVAHGASLCFLSTNKVYGDSPNGLMLTEQPTRFDYAKKLPQPGAGHYWSYGINEGMPVDQTTHSLFGCSKLAADLYVQEYGRYFGLNTVCFRCGCLTGAAHAGAEQHGFLAYLAKCCREGRPYKVYGYKGKQVRDQLHAADVARACEAYYHCPRPGEVYNLGGGRANSISVLEAIAEVERRLGKRLAWEYVDEPRRGDHQVWISDTRKFQEHYPGWRVQVPLAAILDEICR